MVSEIYSLTLKALLNKYHPQEWDAYLKYLQDDAAKNVKDAPAPRGIPNSVLNPAAVIESIHYSWYVDLLKDYDPQLKALIISSLPKEIQGGLQSLLGESVELKSLPRVSQEFFSHQLYFDHLKEAVFPKEFLNNSPLNALLDISKSDLVKIIDLLGIEDLSIDLRKVMDRNTLDEIKKGLKQHQKQYLEIIIKKADLPVVKSEGPKFWQENSKQLSYLIHKKGLMRFAIAIKEQSPHFIWHVTHLLDTGRGNEVLKLLQSAEVKAFNKRTQDLIVHELLNLLKGFKPEIK